jgi:trimethylamine:corrinoid methyltransferase-like protein
MVSKVLEEIHKIRENIYKEQKGLTTKEVVKKIHKEAEEVIKKYGLRFRQKEKIVSHK